MVAYILRNGDQKIFTLITSIHMLPQHTATLVILDCASMLDAEGIFNGKERIL